MSKRFQYLRAIISSALEVWYTFNRTDNTWFVAKSQVISRHLWHVTSPYLMPLQHLERVLMCRSGLLVIRKATCVFCTMWHQTVWKNWGGHFWTKWQRSKVVAFHLRNPLAEDTKGFLHGIYPSYHAPASNQLLIFHGSGRMSFSRYQCWRGYASAGSTAPAAALYDKQMWMSQKFTEALIFVNVVMAVKIQSIIMKT